LNTNKSGNVLNPIKFSLSPTAPSLTMPWSKHIKFSLLLPQLLSSSSSSSSYSHNALECVQTKPSSANLTQSVLPALSPSSVALRGGGVLLVAFALIKSSLLSLLLITRSLLLLAFLLHLSVHCVGLNKPSSSSSSFSCP